jgi:Toxin with a conserved tryptophan and TIP tripeptide motif
MAADNPNASDPLLQQCGEAKTPDAEGVKSDPDRSLPKDREPTCQEIKDRMDFVMRDIARRTAEQLAGRPPGVAYPMGTIIKGRDVSGKDVWGAHDDKLRHRKNELNKLRNRYKDPRRPGGGCDDPPDDPGLQKVDDVVRSPNPNSEDWEKHNNETIDEWIRNHPEAVRTVAAAAAGYVIYRVLRFLPSLLPPLWWTIPENLAIP